LFYIPDFFSFLFSYTFLIHLGVRIRFFSYHFQKPFLLPEKVSGPDALLRIFS
jgi:hypothetical protein